jgi:enamine deaminase RidA (YjgF/YER057c/UK114 family)
MVNVEAKLNALSLTLPVETEASRRERRFTMVRVRGNRAYIAGHGPRNADGSPVELRGKLGADLTTEQGYQMARQAMLTILGNLKRTLGDLDRVTAWLMVRVYSNAAPDFTENSLVSNGASDLILELYGPDVGEHARASPGMASLPNNTPVIVEAEVEIAL